MSLGPRKKTIQDIGISSLGVLIAGFIGSTIILIVAFALSGMFDIVANFEKGGEGNFLFPFILSFITLIGTFITSMLMYYVLSVIDPERYKRTRIIFSQLAFLQVLIYIFIAPVYIILGAGEYNDIMAIYLLHILTVMFGTNIIIEILTNYRYTLIGLYGAFIGLFVTSIFSYIVFTVFGSSYAKLLTLIFLLPVITGLMTFLKQLFEWGYYHYYRITGIDSLGDIFYKLELEDRQQQKEDEQKNLL